jgi:hypothetical protein
MAKIILTLDQDHLQKLDSLVVRLKTENYNQTLRRLIRDAAEEGQS